MVRTDESTFVIGAAASHAIRSPRIQVTWPADRQVFRDTNESGEKGRWGAIADVLALRPVAKSDAPMSPDVVVHVSSAGRIPVPSGAKQVANDKQGAVWRTSNGWLLKRAGYTATVAASTPKATLYASTAPTAMYAFRDLMTMLLPRTGWVPIHAACVQPDDPNTNRPTVLIAGLSGSGKSTLTTGLLLAGWQCISDDLLVLPPPEHERVFAYSMMKAIRICDDAWTRLGLNDAHKKPLDTFGRYASAAKHTLTASALPDRSGMHSNRAIRCPHGAPTCILLPEIVERPTSALVPLSRVQALPALMAESIPTTILPPEAAQGQLQRIGALLRQCTTYRLHAGRDLYQDPSRLASLLQDVASAPVPHP